MLGDHSGAKFTKLISDISEVVECELDILIVISLEAVEEVAKDTDSLISLGWYAFVDLGEPVPD